MKCPPLQPIRISSISGLALFAGLVFSMQAQAADRTGKDVVESYCIACHGTGKDGAPRIGNTADWAPRAKDGLDKLSKNAMTGVRKMPAHGGQAQLSDLEMSRAVAYMVSGGRTPDPNKTYGTVTHGTGEQIVAATCGSCHSDGKGGAPKVGSFEDWRPRLKKGIDGLVSSATSGHNNMPSRGGMANLSDVDIRAAITHMVSKVPQTKP